VTRLPVDQKISSWNLPNLLTMLRLLAVPVVGVLLLHDGGSNPQYRDIAAAVFLVASLTDFVDGALARRRGQVTTFGRIVDPIADKALVGVALIGLSILQEIPWWVTGIILVREVLVTVVRFWSDSQGALAVTHGGKLKTSAQIIAITMYLVALPGVSWWPTASYIALMIAVVLTVVTGLDYLIRAVRHR